MKEKATVVLANAIAMAATWTPRVVASRRKTAAMFRIDRPAVPGFAFGFGAISLDDMAEGLRCVCESIS